MVARQGACGAAAGGDGAHDALYVPGGVPGELGESAGRAVFRAYYDGRYSLARGDAAHAETGGDFEVLDAAGNKTGVWIDFKHYRIGTYRAYRRGGGETTDAECFKAKAQKVGAKRLLIVNVLADEAALELRQKPIDDVGMVYSFPIWQLMEQSVWR